MSMREYHYRGYGWNNDFNLTADVLKQRGADLDLIAGWIDRILRDKAAGFANEVVENTDFNENFDEAKPLSDFDSAYEYLEYIESSIDGVLFCELVAALSVDWALEELGLPLSYYGVHEDENGGVILLEGMPWDFKGALKHLTPESFAEMTADNLTKIFGCEPDEVEFIYYG